MDRELIDRLARQAAAETSALVRVEYPGTPDDLFGRFATLIAEECAKVAESLDDAECDTGWGHTQHDAAAAIRAKFALSEPAG